MSKNNFPHVIFLGSSGSGKSECCKFLETQYGYYNFHPFGFAKRQYETLYRLPCGSLDTVEGKASKAPGMTVSYGEMMVREFHFRREVDPLYVTRNFDVELISALSTRPVALQAIRNIEEAHKIKSLGFSYVLIEIVGRGNSLSSDMYYEEIKSLLSENTQLQVLENTESLNKLFLKLKVCLHF